MTLLVHHSFSSCNKTSALGDFCLFFFESIFPSHFDSSCIFFLTKPPSTPSEWTHLAHTAGSGAHCLLLTQKHVFSPGFLSTLEGWMMLTCCTSSSSTEVFTLSLLICKNSWTFYFSSCSCPSLCSLLCYESVGVFYFLTRFCAPLFWSCCGTNSVWFGEEDGKSVPFFFLTFLTEDLFALLSLILIVAVTSLFLTNNRFSYGKKLNGHLWGLDIWVKSRKC